MDEHKLLREAGRSAEAQSLLDNALFNEALTTLEAEYIKAWKATPVRDVDGREKCWIAVQNVGKIRDHVLSVLTGGKLAAAQLKELADSNERKKRFGIV